jgi:hypothetical protein
VLFLGFQPLKARLNLRDGTMLVVLKEVAVLTEQVIKKRIPQVNRMMSRLNTINLKNLNKVYQKHLKIKQYGI